ncbi:MAG: T9SS type A sorting domain-containing protein [Cyclobacteriaceae bacterium]
MRLSITFIASLLVLVQLHAQETRVFNDATGDGLWSTVANWTEPSGGVPPSPGEKAQMNNSPSIVDQDYSIAQLRNYGTAPETRLNGTGTLTIDNNSASSSPGVIHLSNEGARMLFDLNVIFENSTDPNTFIYVSNSGSTSNLIEFGNNGSVEIKTKTQFVSSNSDPNRSFLFSGPISGVANIVLGKSTNTTFGETSDNSEFDADLVYYQGAIVTVNTSEGNIFIKPNHKVQVNGTDGKLILNTSNAHRGTISLSSTNDFSVDVNANQDSLKNIILGSGNLAFNLDDEVTKVAFADNSESNWGTGTISFNEFRNKVFRFGSNADGLTADQLAQIIIDGGTPALNPYGYLVDLSQNTAPQETTPLEDIALSEGFSELEINLANYITDAENDSIIFEVSTGDQNIILTSISGNILTITEIEEGTTQLNITATDDFNESITVNLGITVSNAAPIVANQLSNLNLEEGFNTHTIDLSASFSDPGNDPLEITATSSNTEVSTVEISGSSLIIHEKGIGTSTITITAEDSQEASVSTTFQVAISDPDNQNPVVAQSIADLTFKAGFASYELDVSEVFTEPDSDDFTLSATSNSESVATVSLTEDNLTITEIGNGTATITLTADDHKGGLGTTSFQVTIAENGIPIAIKSYENVDVYVGFESYTIDISESFSDPDGDDLELSAESSNADIATVVLDGNVLVISEVAAGSVTITLTADDLFGGTESVSFIFSVLTNDPPELGIPIFDQSYIEGFEADTLDLSTAFTDPDQDDIMITAESLDETIIIASVSDNSLILKEVALGEVLVVLTAEDGKGGIANDTITITIAPPLATSMSQSPIIYPNPTSDGKLFIDAPFIKSGTIKVYNIRGDEMYKKHIQNLTHQPLRLDLQIPKGVYLIEIKNEESREIDHQKLIIR